MEGGAEFMVGVENFSDVVTGQKTQPWEIL
jgi:hypothetical protein